MFDQKRVLMATITKAHSIIWSAMHFYRTSRLFKIFHDVRVVCTLPLMYSLYVLYKFSAYLRQRLLAWTPRIKWLNIALHYINFYSLEKKYLKLRHYNFYFVLTVEEVSFTIY